MSEKGVVQESETYAGPMPPEVSAKAVRYVQQNLSELACHYGWSDADLEEDMLEISEYIGKVCVYEEEKL